MLEPSAPVTYKTVKLAAGKHNHPAEGVCVMELASMIAGERFTDHPRSVCPVIAAFLRAYNDAVDDPHRQDLYRLAALAVGTRGSWVIERRRAQLCRRWSEQVWNRRAWPLRVLGRRALRLDGNVKPQALARAAVASIGRHTDQTHAMALALVEEMCAMASPAAQPAAVALPRPPAHLSHA